MKEAGGYKTNFNSFAMRFHLLPVIDIMIELYKSPLNADRFTCYMKILQGNSPGDISVPVTFYNPMGKEQVLKRLLELKKMNAEELINETLKTINKAVSSSSSKEIKVALALADDLGGSWTNRYTTDYDSKFNTTDLIKRNFCTPLFWVSEEYTPEKIREITTDYCYRSVYRETAPQPVTLEEHIMQESFVAEHNMFRYQEKELKNFHAVNAFYLQYKNSNDPPTIFNFLYGDIASKELGHTAFGIKEEWAGFYYASQRKLPNMHEN